MKKNHGFTLVEIVVTVALLAVMLSLVVPGVMNYFTDVDMDKSRAEAESVLAIAENYQYKLSLAGNYDASGDVVVTDDTVKQSIVDKAKGTGKLEVLTFKDGSVKQFRYIISGYSIERSPSGKLLVLDVEDKFYQSDENNY